MAIRKVPGARRVSAKEAHELLKHSPTRDDVLSEQTWSEAHLLNDGRVLLHYRDGKGTLYPSYEALAELIRQTEELARQGPVDLSQTLLPPVGDFLRDVGALAARVGSALRIPDDALDRTQESLDAIDKAVYRLAAAKRMSSEIVTPLVAYVGEVMRLACDGRWTTVNGRNEPMVATLGEQLYQPFAIVIGELTRGRRGSLRGAVNGTLGAHRLSAPQKGS